MKNEKEQYITEILSNSSKWHGQEPDSIETLIDVLGSNTLDVDMFFGKHYNTRSKAYCVQCPISKEDGMYRFFGNFLEVSHVFRIYTNDQKVITQLKTAILNNAGWAEGVAILKRPAKRVHVAYC